jgi:GAF domain-containing protein
MFFSGLKERGTTMLSRARQLLRPPLFADDEEKTRIAGLLHAILVFVLAVGLVFPVIVLVIDPQSLWFNLVAAAILVLGTVGLFFLLRRGRVRLASALFSALFLGVVTVSVMTYGGIRSSIAGNYLLVIVMAGLLLGWRGALSFGVLSVLSAFAAFYAERAGLIPPPYPEISVGDFVLMFLIFVLMAILLSFALRTIATAFARARRAAAELAESNRELQAAQTSLERRTASLQTVTDVSADIAEVLDPEELVRRVVDIVHERFGLYYVGLFLVEGAEGTDAGLVGGQGSAVLHAGSGEAGRQMVAEGYRLPVGGSSMVGQCVSTGEARVELNVHRASIRYANPLLPDTGSELALPLRSRGRVIGAMTVQSTEPAAFRSEDVIIMQTLADQVAAAIDNARLFTEAQEAAERSERVVRRYVQESWDTLVETVSTASGYRYAGQDRGVDEEAWLAAMEVAVRGGDLVVQDDGTDGSSMAVPLILNGVVIGVLGLRRPASSSWDADEQALVRSVAEQMTQALENRRLFQVARERARRELVLRQTTDRVRSQADLDAVLQTAAQEMRRIVGATHVAIRLGTGGRSVDVADSGPVGEGDGRDGE